MQFTDRVANAVRDRLSDENRPVEITPELYESIQQNLGDGKLLLVRPFPENEGMDAGIEVMQALYDVKTRFLGLQNTSESYTFEIWFRGGKLQFFFYVDDQDTEQKLRKQLHAHYPNAKIIEQNDLFPEVYEGDYIAASKLTLKKSKYMPVRNPEGVREFISDPYKSITSEMVASDETRVVTQMTFKPAKYDWTKGGTLGKYSPFSSSVMDVAEGMRGDQLMNSWMNIKTRNPTKEERQLAEEIAMQDGMPAYHLNIRILVLSPYAAEAKSVSWGIGKAFEQSFQEKGGQSFTPIPQNTEPRLDGFLSMMTRRDWTDEDMVLTIPEVASVAHIPNDSIETGAVDWNYTRTGAKVPGDAERYEDVNEERDELDSSSGVDPLAEAERYDDDAPFESSQSRTSADDAFSSPDPTESASQTSAEGSSQDESAAPAQETPPRQEASEVELPPDEQPPELTAGDDDSTGVLRRLWSLVTPSTDDQLINPDVEPDRDTPRTRDREQSQPPTDRTNRATDSTPDIDTATGADDDDGDDDDPGVIRDDL